MKPRKGKTEDANALDLNGVEQLTGDVTAFASGRHHKSDTILRLPQVQGAIAEMRAGLQPGKGAGVKLSADFIAKLNITTPGRIAKEIFETLIREEKLTAANGAPLQAIRHKNSDGGETVYVTDRVEHIKRSSSIKRTRQRHAGGR